MKLRTALVFLSGLLVGAAVMFAIQLARERQQEASVAKTWRRTGGTGLLPYFRPAVRVPIPQNLDLSTNTWRQLVFWDAFASSFCYQGTNPFVDRPSLRTYGFSMSDPNWFMYADKMQGREFAREVLSLNARGLNHDELVQWVSTNYKSSPSHTYCEDYLDMLQKTLATTNK